MNAVPLTAMQWVNLEAHHLCIRRHDPRAHVTGFGGGYTLDQN